MYQEFTVKSECIWSGAQTIAQAFNILNGMIDNDYGTAQNEGYIWNSVPQDTSCHYQW